MDDEVYKYDHGRLPHWRFKGALYFVTFNTVKNILLNNPDREIILESVLYWHKKGYEVLSSVVMPDHVHILCKIGEDEEIKDLTKIITSIKKFTARRINKRQGRKGHFWGRESFDRIIRNEKEYFDKINYIWLNPYKAGLVTHPDNYPYSWFSEER